jgi:hypothetical protein
MSGLRNYRLVEERGDNEREHEVSTAEMQRRVQQDGQAAYNPTVVDKVTLFDQVDGTSMRVPDYMAMQMYLKKQVVLCTACNQYSAWHRDIQNHIRLALQKAGEHRDAEAMNAIGPEGRAGKQCSACGQTFFSDPSVVHQHIRLAKEGGPLHARATVRIVQQYGYEPPAPKSTWAPIAEVERRPGRRRRRRRHGHKEQVSA